MGTTITPSTLTVQIKEEITLGGTSYDQTVTKSIADIASYSKRILKINASSSHVVAQFGDSTVNDLYDVQDVKYIRITNLDDASAIIVTASGDNEAGALELNPQESFQMFNGKVSGATAKAAITSVDDIESIYVHNATGVGIDIELVIATV